MKDKIDEIYYLVKKKNDESDNKLICILALVGGALVVALIAYAVYRFLTPDYFEDYDDDDFDDDFDRKLLRKLLRKLQRKRQLRKRNNPIFRQYVLPL